MEDKVILAIDFDGVIAQDIGWPAMGEPVEGAIDCIRELHKANCFIIIWTCRSGKDQDLVREYLKKYDIPYATINEHYPEHIIKYKSDCRKIFATYYIDDRNIGGWIGWKAVREWLIEKEVLKEDQHPYFNL